MSVLRSSSSSSRVLLPREISILCKAHLSFGTSQSRSFSSALSVLDGHPSSSSPSGSYCSPSTPPRRSLSFPDKLPKFKARGSDISVLNRPDQFYSFLIDSIKQAKRRIFLASLYIGKEETELVSVKTTRVARKIHIAKLQCYHRYTRSMVHSKPIQI